MTRLRGRGDAAVRSTSPSGVGWQQPESNLQKGSYTGIRREAGERSCPVLRRETDADKIVHFSVWTSTADARRFFGSPRLVQTRKHAGVKSPKFIPLEPIEIGTL